jgi:hypothetical protein
MPNEQPQTSAPDALTLKEFFEKVPPGSNPTVRNFLIPDTTTSGATSVIMNLPLIDLHCETESCNGIRLFEPTERAYARLGDRNLKFITFRCRNCKKTEKTYAISFSHKNLADNLVIYKFGEYPQFGPPTSARLTALIGPEKEYFLKGRKAENQGLGIAAFAYYRRVVENQKGRILFEIIRAAEKLGEPKEVIDDLKTALRETKSSTAVSAVKHLMPQVLLMNAHNPLTLLAAALTEGLRAQTDEQYLELASSIRIVLSDLAERLGNALDEQVELNAALTRLMQPNR